jgi:DNA-binding transcriptional regulator YiaG
VTNLAKIQSYVPQVVVDKLAEYRQTRQLQSISQAIAAALSEFFGTEIIYSNSTLSTTTISERVELLEAKVNQLIKQLPAVEQKHSSASPPLYCSATDLSVEPLQPLKRTYLTKNLSTNLLLEEEDCHHQEADLPQINNPNSRSPISLKLDHPNQTQTEISSEDWIRGIVTNVLVARLKTNRSTLKKYLRDLNQIQWAVERDPDGLGWIYDPLLECYYPVQMSTANDVSTVSTSSDANAPKLLETCPTQNVSFGPDLGSVSCKILECKGGLTQSQLSRLTGISVNTLQRWKELPDCLERIRCRTEGAFAYFYSLQNRRFYPFRSNSSYSVSSYTSTGS